MRKPSEPLSYEQKVHQFLRDCQEGTYLVNKLCKPENKEKFIEAVKSYIDKGIQNDYVVEFSTDYSKIKKFDVFFSKDGKQGKL